MRNARTSQPHTLGGVRWCDHGIRLPGVPRADRVVDARADAGSATEVMLADALVLRNLLHLNMISTRKPGQSITCLSLPVP